jgi:hypothetical protein
LAAACAEAGRFDEAIENAQKAITLAEAARQTDVAATNRKHLLRYRAHQPVREPSIPSVEGENK